MQDGTHLTESYDVRICRNLAEANARDILAAEALMGGCNGSFRQVSVNNSRSIKC